MLLQKVSVLYNNASTPYSISIQKPAHNQFWVATIEDIQALLPTLQQNIPGYSGARSWYVWEDHVLILSTSYNGIPMNPPYSSMFSSPTPL
jgi:hypothetical protein